MRIIQRINDYIEFAEARKCFSDVGFYKDVRNIIISLENENKNLKIHLVNASRKLQEKNDEGAAQTSTNIEEW